MDKPTPRAQENALLAQERINWLESNATKVLFKSIGDEILALTQQARQLAADYSINQNHLKIIQLLQQANALAQIIEKHGKHH